MQNIKNNFSSPSFSLLFVSKDLERMKVNFVHNNKGKKPDL